MAGPGQETGATIKQGSLVDLETYMRFRQRQAMWILEVEMPYLLRKAEAWQNGQTWPEPLPETPPDDWRPGDKYEHRPMVVGSVPSS